MIVGYYSAHYFSTLGQAKVTTVVEHDGYVTNPFGLDIEALLAHRNETGSILHFDGAQTVEGNSLKGIELECDILIPAALEKQITFNNAHNVRRRTRRRRRRRRRKTLEEKIRTQQEQEQEDNDETRKKKEENKQETCRTGIFCNIF